MDEIKEIEEIKGWIEQNREWLPIKYLLSRNKELEDNIEFCEMRNVMGNARENAACKRALQAEAKIKELENNVDDPYWCCEKHKEGLVARIEGLEEAFNDQVEMRSKLTTIKFELEARIKELEEGIEKVLKWRDLDGDGISDPLRKELYGLVRKEKL